METRLLNLYNKVTKSDYEQTAFKIFVDDLLQNKKTGLEKSNTLTGLDMESQVPFSFVPSMFYTFMYASPNVDITDGTKFIDVVPLILCLNSSDTTVSGLNFNFLPNNVRAVVIDILRDTDQEFYDNIGTEYKINERLASFLMSNYPSFIKIIADMTNYNIAPAYRQYSIAHINTPRLIEYDQWDYIPFLNFRDAVRGANLAAVQKSLAVNNTDK